MGERLYQAELPRSIHAPRAARQLMTKWLREDLGAEEVETSTLLVSELVSNAVRHGRGRIELRADLDGDRLLVEVTDEGSGLERTIRDREFEQVEGWGLKIVDAVASRWGVHEGTTHVWFELERAGPRLGAETKPTAR
jgi:anti-sigma regulatory factor (Ser/Thr protein kinase)